MAFDILIGVAAVAGICGALYGIVSLALFFSGRLQP